MGTCACLFPSVHISIMFSAFIPFFLFISQVSFSSPSLRFLLLHQNSITDKVRSGSHTSRFTNLWVPQIILKGHLLRNQLSLSTPSVFIPPSYGSRSIQTFWISCTCTGSNFMNFQTVLVYIDEGATNL